MDLDGTLAGITPINGQPLDVTYDSDVVGGMAAAGHTIWDFGIVASESNLLPVQGKTVNWKCSGTC